MPSVMSPEGTISHTMRGLSSLETSSSSEAAPTAPVLDGGRDGVRVRVERDHLVVRVALDAMDHVAAHLAEPDESDLHV